MGEISMEKILLKYIWVSISIDKNFEFSKKLLFAQSQK